MSQSNGVGRDLAELRWLAGLGEGCAIGARDAHLEVFQMSISEYSSFGFGTSDTSQFQSTVTSTSKAIHSL